MENSTAPVTIHFHLIDWVVIAAYAVGVLGAGWFYNRRNKNADDYLVGGRNMRPWAVGLSFFVAVFSTLTYLSLPGEMIRNGPLILAGRLALPLVFWIAGWHLIPVFMRLRVTSGNELLDRRLGGSVRQTGVVFYLMMRMMWMGLILYATVDKVVVPMTGLTSDWTPWICLLLAVITIVYTAMGGLKAIVAIDALQSFLLFGGVLLSLGLITYYMGGFGAWWPREWADSWAEPHWISSPTGDRTVLASFVAVFMWYICTSGSDQMAIQRYSATRDAPAARRMLLVSLIASFAIQMLLSALGLALFAYATTNPTFIPEGQTPREAADRLFPIFIMTALPAGVSGLIIAGLLAEAMNSLSSGVSAASTVVVTDLIGRFRRTRGTPDGDLRLARWISVLIGALVVLLSMCMVYVQGNLLEVSYKVVNLLVAPLFGLFFMAIFVRWATAFGTLLGAAAGLTVAVTINYWRDVTGQDPPIGFLWAMPASLAVQIVVGTLASIPPIGVRSAARDPGGWAEVNADPSAHEVADGHSPISGRLTVAAPIRTPAGEAADVTAEESSQQ